MNKLFIYGDFFVMACFHPLLGKVIGINPITGKDKLQVLPYDQELVDRWNNNDTKFYEIPCGKCIGCRLEYSRQWANRMMLELQYHDSAFFVTLTYSDDFLPRNPVVDQSTGEYRYDSFTLRKAHLSKFIKHVRKHYPDQNIRFYGAGEYGSTTVRPHYHIIIFGLRLDDLVMYKRTSQGDVLYTSPGLNECWSNFFGYDSKGLARYDQIGWCVVAPVTWETCAYVARYVNKKMSGSLESWFITNNMEMPFSLMSRRPGIGKKWYDEHPNFWEYSDFINVQTCKKGIKFRPPRYFDKLLEQDIPEVYQARREEKSEFVKRSRELLEKNLDKPYLEYLADKEFLLKNRLKVLDRSEV